MKHRLEGKATTGPCGPHQEHSRGGGTRSGQLAHRSRAFQGGEADPQTPRVGQNRKLDPQGGKSTRKKFLVAQGIGGSGDTGGKHGCFSRFDYLHSFYKNLL